MSFFPFLKKDIRKNERIIISRTDKIGDLILSIPSFYMVRKMFPTSKIVVLVRKYNASIVKNLSFIDETWTIDDDKEIFNKKIKDFNADIFAALYSDNKVLKTALKSCAKYRIGPLSKPLSWFVYNYGVYQKRSKSIKNEAEYNLDIIKSINPTLFDKNFEIGGKITYSSENNNIAENFLKSNNINSPFILIHPFMGGSAKNFTDEEYTILTEKISNIDSNIDIILTSSSSDYQRLQIMKSKLKSNKIHIYKNGDDILDLSALIDKCELYVGGSTGPSHIAGNLRKKSVLIYPAKKSQSPVRWGLYGNNNSTYIIPDIDNPNEDYSKKTFDIINNELLTKSANIIYNKFKENI